MINSDAIFLCLIVFVTACCWVKVALLSLLFDSTFLRFWSSLYLFILLLLVIVVQFQQLSRGEGRSLVPCSLRKGNISLCPYHSTVRYFCGSPHICCKDNVWNCLCRPCCCWLLHMLYVAVQVVQIPWKFFYSCCCPTACVSSFVVVIIHWIQKTCLDWHHNVFLLLFVVWFVVRYCTQCCCCWKIGLVRIVIFLLFLLWFIVEVIHT